MIVVAVVSAIAVVVAVVLERVCETRVVNTLVRTNVSSKESFRDYNERKICLKQDLVENTLIFHKLNLVSDIFCVSCDLITEEYDWKESADRNGRQGSPLPVIFLDEVLEML